MHIHFTLDQARRALVYVRPIVQDVQREAQKLYKLNLANSVEEKKIHAQLGTIEHLLEELVLVGCFCRNMEKGIIDFPAKKGGREIFYSWSLDENEQIFWRYVEEPYECRHSLNESVTKNNETTDPVTSLH